MNLYGKRVVITGASSGIGLELLKLLLQKGCRVVACARSIDKVSIKSDRLYLKKCDVSEKAQIDELFSYAMETLGGIDLFIANAGFAYYEKIEGPDWEHIEKIFKTNFTGSVYCAEKMKELHGASPFNFVVTASAMGLLSLPGYALYSATKAAVRGFADAYRFELAPGQHFQVVYPVATKTKFFESAGNNTPVPWPTQTAKTVAERIIGGIMKNSDHIFPSKTFYFTNLAARFCPFIFDAYVEVNNRSFRKWLRQSGSDENESTKTDSCDAPSFEGAIPAPWNLQGKGYIMLYKFSRDFVAKEGRVPGFLKGRFIGGLGSVMLVDYQNSDAGPYGELLFIPGMFLHNGKLKDTISKIYVSSEASVINGRANWGIPKELADFRFERINATDERITVSVGDRKVGEFEIATAGPKFPVNTKMLPFPLVQRYKGKTLYTKFSGKGWGRFSRIRKVDIDPAMFPDISKCRPIAVIKVEPFDITFPKAEV